MAYLRPVVLLVILAACLAVAWLLGAGGERAVEVPAAAERARAPGSEATVAQGPALVGAARASPAPVLVGAAAPPRRAPLPGGATEVGGVVIDDRGRAYPTGWVRAVRGGTKPILLGEAPVVEGRFRLTLALEGDAQLNLSHLDAPHVASPPTFVSAAPGERIEGVELLVQPMGVLEVEVSDVSGAPALEAAVEAFTGHTWEPERLSLDGQGRARRALPPLFHSWIRATSPDGRFFVRESFTIAPGATTRVALRLAGPWERLAVRVLSEPTRLRTGEKALVTVAKREPVVAEVEGPPVFVWIPPHDGGFPVDASLGELGRARLEVGPGREERERVLRDGVSVVVPLRARVTVELVDAFARPVPGVRLWLNPWARAPDERGSGLSDEHGHASLGAHRIGVELALHGDWGPVGKLVVPADGSPQRVVLPDPLSAVAGVIDPSTPPGLVPGGVHLHVGGAYVNAIVDRTPRPEGYRWRTYVPFPRGTPLTAHAGDPLGPGVEGACGQEDLRLRVQTGTLEIAPRTGPVLRPRGHLRIQVLPLGSSRNEIGAVELDPSWGFCPRWTGLAPGRYQASWRPQGASAWRVAPEPIEVQVGENRVEIDFGPP